MVLVTEVVAAAEAVGTVISVMGIPLVNDNRRGNPAGVSNPWPMGHMWPRMAMNMAQHKIVNLLKTFSLLIS